MCYPSFITAGIQNVMFYFLEIVSFSEPFSKSKDCSGVESSGFGTFRL